MGRSLGFVFVLGWFAGCGQIIEVPVAVGTEGSTSVASDSSGVADDVDSSSDATTDDMSTGDIDMPTGTSGGESTGTGGQAARDPFCDITPRSFDDNGGVVVVAIEVDGLEAVVDVRVGVRVLRPEQAPLAITVDHTVPRTLLDVELCPSMVDLLFEDDAEVAATVACTSEAPEFVETVAPGENLAPLIGDDPNGTWLVTVTQNADGVGGSVDSVCISFAAE